MQNIRLAPAAFAFHRGCLVDHLCRHTSENACGHWRVQAALQTEVSGPSDLYLTVVQGNIVFAGQQPLAWESLQAQLLRYIPRLRSPSLTSTWQSVQSEAEGGTPLTDLLHRLVSVDRLFTEQEMTSALWTSCLNQFDHCWDLEGQATFAEEPQVAEQAPTRGVSFTHLQTAVNERQSQWQQLQSSIPSTQQIVVGHREKIEQLPVSKAQRQNLLSITQQKRSIDDIAYNLGVDKLKIAQLLHPLLRAGLAALQGADTAESNSSLSPEPTAELQPTAEYQDSVEQELVEQESVEQGSVDIVVVDDSPILLKQFEALVSTSGYSMRGCSKASDAVAVLLRCLPSIIFVDINMPEMSGFQLVREIRLQPSLSEIPIVILTAEESFSNLQRARWSKCDFLAKPMNSQDINSFRSDLLDTLSKCESLAVAS